MDMAYLLWAVPAGSALALLFAAFTAFSILREKGGTKLMSSLSNFIRQGAKAFLKRQYRTVAIVGAFVTLVFTILAYIGEMSFFTPYAFVHGMVTCALAGYVGMMVSSYANVRTTNAAKRSLNAALRIAFNSGTVMGLFVVGIVLFDISVWYLMLNHFYPGDLVMITDILVSSAIGTSFMAFFARVGGGIYTKSADVGADLVGKVEKGIPEDDLRNAAVIADQVGDNVGDVAGMGADLHESYLSAILASASLGVFAFAAFSGAVTSFNAMLAPMLIMVAGIVSSIIGSAFVRMKGNRSSQSALLTAVRKGVYSASVLSAMFSFVIIYYLFGLQYIGFFISVLSGLFAGVIIGSVSEYFTSSTYYPTKRVAKSSVSGAGPLIINGMSVGMMSTAVPILVISAVIIISYFVSGGVQNYANGLYAISLSTVGMLSTLGITLATEAYGPVADNAAGIAQMSKQKKVVRNRLDMLDAIGNTTAATGKGYVIASGAMTVLSLIAAYVAVVGRMVGSNLLSLSIADPIVVSGLFIGVMLPFLFSSLTMRSVGKGAEKIIEEVRRQFRTIRGLMKGKAKPDYSRCVDIVTKTALRELAKPGLVAILSPILVGLLLGPKAAISLLVGVLVSAFSMAIMMSNAGASWDNAKKYIESGKFGGKGSDAHKAAVLGDTIGDPFKDTSGPSLDGLMKLMAMVSLVVAPIVVKYALL
jgi:K(+)-stimulated pyrophosphate-energized sodium pump